MNKRIIVEEGAVSKLPEIISEFPKVLIVTTEELVDLFKDWIHSVLDLENVTLHYLSDYSVKEASIIANKLIIEYYDCVVSIGGGTVNDTCKLAARYSEKTFISFPTIVSNDGVCSNTAVLKFDGSRTDGLPAKSPDIIIVDTNLVKSAPIRFLRAGIGDIVSNYTALYDWDLAVKNNKEERNDVARIISSNALYNILNLSEPINPESSWHIKLVCESLILSGIAMEMKGNTRPCSGSEHLFNHSINMYYTDIKVLHGYLVALGALVSSLIQGQDYNLIVNYFKKNNIDVRPSALGISKDIFVEAWKKAPITRPKRYTILNEKVLNDEELEKIYDKIESEVFI